MKDFYKILNIEETANKEDIKKSYRNLAKQFHPDTAEEKDKKLVEEKFKEIAEAYEILSDDKKKSDYDLKRQYKHNSHNYTTSNFDFSDFANFDIFSNSGFADTFDSFINKKKHQAPAKGQDLRITISVSLEDISKDQVKKIKILKNNKCSTCKGSGINESSISKVCSYCQGSGYKSLYTYSNRKIECDYCNGTGFVKDKCTVCIGTGVIKNESTLEIKIPAGIKDGTELAYKDQGNAIKNGINGDLIVLIKEKEHEIFTRRDNDLIYTLNLSYLELLLGCKKEVPTLDQKIEIQIKECTHPNKILKISSKGLPDYLHSNFLGDLLIKINLEMPKELKENEKELLIKIQETK